MVYKYDIIMDNGSTIHVVDDYDATKIINDSTRILKFDNNRTIINMDHVVYIICKKEERKVCVS